MAFQFLGAKKCLEIFESCIPMKRIRSRIGSCRNKWIVVEARRSRSSSGPGAFVGHGPGPCWGIWAQTHLGGGGTLGV